MIRCHRAAAPPVLEADGPRWTAAFVARREADPRAAFRWPVREGVPLNRHLLPELLAMTDGHCAYCDGWPLDATGQPSIDHFRPKSRFPELAFAWANLFPSCDRCQGSNGKAEQWDDRLLNPDEPTFTFGEYSRFVSATGRIEPNPEASVADQDRARVTIDLFDLNGGSRPQMRKRARDLYGTYEEVNRPYRFVFDA